MNDRFPAARTNLPVADLDAEEHDASIGHLMTHRPPKPGHVPTPVEKHRYAMPVVRESPRSVDPEALHTGLW